MEKRSEGLYFVGGWGAFKVTVVTMVTFQCMERSLSFCVTC